MKKTLTIGCTAILMGGCNPTRKVDQKYTDTYQTVSNLLEECAQLASAGRANELSGLGRRDSWDTPILISVSDESSKPILVVVAAGADCMHHTQDDITETRPVRVGIKAAEQVVPPNGP